MSEQQRQEPFNIEVLTGEDYKLSITFKTSAKIVIDVSGSTFYGGIFRTGFTTIDWVIDMTDAVTGIVIFSVPNATTQDFTKEKQKRKYEIWEEDSNSDRFLRMFGEVDILEREFETGP